MELEYLYIMQYNLYKLQSPVGDFYNIKHVMTIIFWIEFMPDNLEFYFLTLVRQEKCRCEH